MADQSRRHHPMDPRVSGAVEFPLCRDKRVILALAHPAAGGDEAFGSGGSSFSHATSRSYCLLWLLHLRLYRQRKQGTQFKYDSQWLDTDNPKFLFRNQTIDDLIWTLGSGVPIWTAYEVVSLWLFANGYIPFLNWATHPIWFVALMLLIPFFREVHFYLIHRLIHWPPLYRSVHKLHHANVNPGPWSGLAITLSNTRSIFPA